MSGKATTDKPLKIGLVVNEFFCTEYPPLGGFGLTAKNFAEFFNSQSPYKAEVVALLPPYRGEGETPRELHGTRIIAAPRKLTWRNYPTFRSYRNELAKENFDLLVSIEHYPNYFGRLTALPKVPWIHWIRDPKAPFNWDRIMDLRQSGIPCEYTEESTSQYRGYAKLQILRRLMGRKFHCGIQEMWLVDRARAGYPLIGNDFSKLVNRISLPDRTLEKSAKPVVLFIGRLVAVKRPWIYFELARRLPGVDFWVVGEMDKRQQQTEAIQHAQQIPNLQFLGKKVGQELDRILESAWVLVNTSIHEGMPQSILQALAYEVPVVSALDFGGTISKYGTFVGEAKGDGLDEIEAFTNAIKDLLKRDNERLKLGQSGKRYVKHNYTQSAFLKQFLQILKSMDIQLSKSDKQ